MTQTSPTPDPAPQDQNKGVEEELETPIRVQRLRFKTQSPTQSPSPEANEDAGPAESVAPPKSSVPPPGRKSTKSGSSPASSLVDVQTLADGIEGGVLVITGQIHELLARDAYDQWAQIYLADEQDAKGIAQPVAAIIGRRTGEVTGNPDVIDGITAGIALAFYSVKQIGKVLSAKRARRQGNEVAFPSEDGSDIASAL